MSPHAPPPPSSASSIISATRSKLEDFPTAEFDALFGLDPSLHGGRGNRPSGKVLPLILRTKRRRLAAGQDATEEGGEGGVAAAEEGGVGAAAQDGPVEEQASIPTVSDDDSSTAAAAAASASNGAADLLSGIIDAQVFAVGPSASGSTSTTNGFTTPQLSTLLNRTHAALDLIQRQLHRGEELYHADTDARGNLYKGWDAILDARSEDVGAGESDFMGEDPNFGGGGGGFGFGGMGSGTSGGGGTGPSRRMPLDNRWFSGSCPTFAVGGAGRGRQGKKLGGGAARPSLLVAGVASPVSAGGVGAGGGGAAARSPGRAAGAAVAGTPASSRSAAAASAAAASAATPASSNTRGPPILPTPQGPKVNVNVSVKGQLNTPAQADAVHNPIDGTSSTAASANRKAAAAEATAVMTRPVGPAAVPKGLVPGGGAPSSSTAAATSSSATPPPPTTKASATAASDAQDVEMEDAAATASQSPKTPAAAASGSATSDAKAAEAATPAPAPAPATGGRASSRKSTRKRTRG